MWYRDSGLHRRTALGLPGHHVLAKGLQINNSITPALQFYQPLQHGLLVPEGEIQFDTLGTEQIGNSHGLPPFPAFVTSGSKTVLYGTIPRPGLQFKPFPLVFPFCAYSQEIFAFFLLMCYDISHAFS